MKSRFVSRGTGASVRPCGRATLPATLALAGTLFVACQPTTEQATGDGPREVPQYTIEQFLETTSVFGGSFSPDESKLLVSSNESGIFNAYAIPVDGGEALQLTDSEDDAVFVGGYFPADERFLYLQDEGGNELGHLFVHELDRTATDLTPGEGLKAVYYGWADDDESFFLGSNERDSRFFDVYEVDPATYEQTLAFRDTVAYSFAGVSPDERHFVFQKENTNADNDLFLYERQKGEMRHLTPHEGDVSHHAQDFSPDGKSLYLTTNEGAEFSYLVRQDLASGAREVVLQPEWDVWYAYFSKNGRYMVVGINEDARTRIRVFQMPEMEEVELPDLSGLDITSVRLSRHEDRMAFFAASGREPRNLYVMDFPGGEPRPLTSTLSPEIEPDHLVQPEVVRFASYDGVEVPGLFYRPHAASAEAPVPALVWVHGGPGGQSRIGYSGLIQYLVNHGYAVYAINNRGSTGYGKTFYHMDDRKHGDADLDDVVASKAMLAERRWVDGGRIAVGGGSYGGYMTLAALTFRPEEFAAGVDLYGISNWVRTVQSIPPWWESFRKALEQEMGDFEDETFFHDKSPLFHAERIRRPLIVLQGANDPRVLKAESDEIVEAVQANGIPVEYVLFADEGHGFVKKENQAEAYRKILAFLDRHVKGVEPTESATEE